MKFKPLVDRILVEKIEDDEKTKGGIFIPQTAKERPSMGKVLAVGPGKRLDDGGYRGMDVKVGDTVLWAKYSGAELEVDGKKLFFIEEDELLAVLVVAKPNDSAKR